MEKVKVNPQLCIKDTAVLIQVFTTLAKEQQTLTMYILVRKGL